MYRRNLKAIIVAFVLVSGFGIGTAAHVSAADTMSPQGAAQSKSVNQKLLPAGTATTPVFPGATDNNSFLLRSNRRKLSVPLLIKYK